MSRPVVASVCSGIGGAELAFAGLADHAFMAEIDPFARVVLAHHFPHTELHGDFTKVTHDGPVDVLVGGTPCQSFSIAGLRRGMADERGNLALEFLRLADRLRAKWVLWENVPGVLSSGGGRDFGSFLGGLGELGYGFAYRVLDAQYFGLAQRRKRVFVVGCLGDWRRAAAILLESASLRGDPAPRREARERVAPTLESGANRTGGDRPPGTTVDTAESLITGSLTSNGDAHSGFKDELGLVAYGGNRQSGPLDVATAVNAHGGPHGRLDFESETFITAYRVHADGSTAMTGNGNAAAAAAVDVAMALDTCGGFAAAQGGNLITHSLRAGGFDASEDGTGRGTPLVSMAFHENQRAELSTSDTCGSLNVGGGKPGQGYPAVSSGSSVRRLTPRECARLQGFPDDWLDITFRGKPASDGAGSPDAWHTNTKPLPPRRTPNERQHQHPANAVQRHDARGVPGLLPRHQGWQTLEGRGRRSVQGRN